MNSSCVFFPIFISSSLAFPSSYKSSSIVVRQQTIERITHILLFADTIDQFETTRNAKNPPSLDWISDGCTDSPDKPFNLNFLPGCQRHDFGYRNYKAQSRFTLLAKARIDSNLKTDLENICMTQGSLAMKGGCQAAGEIYFEVVKVLGNLKRRDFESAAAHFEH